MDREEIIRMAREAGFKVDWQHADVAEIKAKRYEYFAALVAKAERHRICEMLRERHKQEERHNYYGFIANMIEESA